IDDIVTISNDEGIVRVRHGVAGGQPIESMTEAMYALDRLVRDAATMDVDGDGRVDLVLAGASASLGAMYQDGEGKLQGVTDLDVRASYLTTGDLTGDGELDLVVTEDKRITI